MSTMVDEIVEKIRTGEYRMVVGNYRPLERRSSLGEWLPVYKYHPNTIRAASRRLVRRYDEAIHMGFMVYPS